MSGWESKDEIDSLVCELADKEAEIVRLRKELKATQLVSLHLINELEEIASYDTTSECDEFDEEEQVEADVLIKRARAAVLKAKP